MRATAAQCFAAWRARKAKAPRCSRSRPIASITSAQVLTAASPDAQNTLDQPEAVAPAALAPAPTIAAGGKGLHLEMPPWSLVVVTATLSARGEIAAA